jgi:predicted ABC-type ATPase
MKLADTWLLFNNADAIPRLIAKEKDGKTEVIDKDLFREIMKVVR